MNRLVVALFFFLCCSFTGRVAALNQGNIHFIITQVQPGIHAAQMELKELRRVILKDLFMSSECQDPQTIKEYKRRIDFIITRGVTEIFTRCESVYTEWGTNTDKDYTLFQRILFKHTVIACIETAKRIALSRLQDMKWECI